MRGIATFLCTVKLQVTPEVRLLVDTVHAESFTTDEELMQYFAVFVAFVSVPPSHDIFGI